MPTASRPMSSRSTPSARSSRRFVGEIVNLRTVRKRKARDDRTKRADQNRAIHGRSKTERLMAEAEARQADHRLDGHRRDITTTMGRDDAS